MKEPFALWNAVLALPRSLHLQNQDLRSSIAGVSSYTETPHSIEFRKKERTNHSRVKC